MNRSRLVWFALVAFLAIGAGGVWLNAQPRVAAGTFDSVLASPVYIVVSSSTPVLFTAQITDRQLKKRSVVLLRLDSAGKPSDILGRLRDDGRNGDVSAGDNIYSLRTNLNEPTVGTVNFQIAARFKPGRWSEPESDDDDWDTELSTVTRTVRDQPARQTRMASLLKRLSRYTLSNQVAVTVDPFKLPPDPGEAGKLTLAGIDSDNDGVRDDVQRYLAHKFSSEQQTRSALITISTSQQRYLLERTDHNALVEATEQFFRAWNCLRSVRGSDDSADAILDDLNEVILNTQQRRDANELANRQLSGAVLPRLIRGGASTQCRL